MFLESLNPAARDPRKHVVKAAVVQFIHMEVGAPDQGQDEGSGRMNYLHRLAFTLESVLPFRAA